MKPKTYLKILAAALLLFASATARDLSYTDALALAKEHSYKLKIASSNSESARQNLNAAKAERMPTLSMNAMASYKDEIPALEIDLPGMSFSRDFGFKETYQLDLLLTLPLYTGGKISSGINIARANHEYQKALSQADLDMLYLLTRLNYLKLHQADKLLEAAHSALKRSRIIYDDTQSLFSAGAADSIDIFEADLLLNNSKLNLENKITQRRKAEIELAVFLGLPPDETITISEHPPEPADPENLAPNLSSAKPELLAMASLVDINRHRLNLNRADYLPTVSAFGGYSYGKPNIDPFNDAFNDNFTVGAKLSWGFNLGGKTKAKSQNSRYQLESARHSYSGLEEDLNRQLKIALENLKLAFRRYKTSEKNYNISSKTYLLATGKKNAGILSTNRLLEIEADLTTAEKNLNSTALEYHVLLSQFYYIKGDDKLKEGI